MTVGIDFAKNVFSLCGVDENGKAELRHTVRRWGLRINIGINEPTNRALILSVMICRFRREELDTLLTQSQRHFHPCLHYGDQ